MSICPRCGNEYDDFPALSRRDNKTDICSACGTEEALIDASIIPPTANEIKFLQLVTQSK